MNILKNIIVHSVMCYILLFSVNIQSSNYSESHAGDKAKLVVFTICLGASSGFVSGLIGKLSTFGETSFFPPVVAGIITGCLTPFWCACYEQADNDAKTKLNSVILAVILPLAIPIAIAEYQYKNWERFSHILVDINNDHHHHHYHTYTEVR